MRRKALFEALEQRFMLSAEMVIPPPPPPVAPPAALEAPLDPKAAVQSEKLTASSTPVLYTIEGAAPTEAEAKESSPADTQADLSGVAATTPTIAQIDPALAKAGDASLQTLKGVETENVASPAVVATEKQAEPVATAQPASTTHMSLAAYAAYVQNRPAPAQVVIVDAAVANYQTLVQSLANFGRAP
jgi:hypothetical protein